MLHDAGEWPERVEKKFRNPLTLFAGSRILRLQLGRKKSKHISP